MSQARGFDRWFPYLAEAGLLKPGEYVEIDGEMVWIGEQVARDEKSENGNE